jgi:L-lactate dehydrogenase complex protein LldF
LCGACYEACSVKINIKSVLIHLRNKVVSQNPSGMVCSFDVDVAAMKAIAANFRIEPRFKAGQRLGRIADAPLVRKNEQGLGWIRWLPGILGGWSQARHLQQIPNETFRDWWEKGSGHGK